MPTIEFIGQSVQHQAAPGANSARLLNCYREAVPQGGVTRHIVKPVLGQVQIADLGTVLQRRIEWVDGQLYTAAGGTLYRFTEDGTTFTIGSIKDSMETTISGNTGYVTVCAGGKYYTWDGASLSQPSSGAFADFGSVDQLSTYTLLTERNGRRFQWSDAADPTTLGALDFATTESGEDNNIRGMVLNGNYWIFKERSIEIWYPTGVSSSLFQRITGGVIDTGLKGFNLVTKARGALFFIGRDGIAYITTGQGIQPVSVRAVEESIRQNNATHCFFYEADGHKFCVIRFSDRPAWVFDIATGEWHERSEGSKHEAWSAVTAAQGSTGAWFAGAYLGELVKLDRVWTDKGNELFRRMITRTLRFDGALRRIPEMEILGAYGYNTAAAQSFFYLSGGGATYIGFDDDAYLSMGSSGEPEPQMVVKTSGDSGATFSAGRAVDMGSQGQYNQRAILRRLGAFRAFTAQIDITHPYEMPIYSDIQLRVA